MYFTKEQIEQANPGKAAEAMARYVRCRAGLFRSRALAEEGVPCGCQFCIVGKLPVIDISKACGSCGYVYTLVPNRAIYSADEYYIWTCAEPCGSSVSYFPDIERTKRIIKGGKA